MVNRFYNPDEQFADATGTPYAGGFLYFYVSGTSTPLTTYSDSLLASPNTNPIVLDAAGRCGSVFLQTLPYKVILKDINGNLIWTQDPVATSDYTGVAQFSVNAGNPNGLVAGTAGSGSIPSSVIWDTTNNILYVCTTTGTAVTAVWTAVNSTAAAAIVPPPQGYLTLTSATPVIPGDVVAATAIFYTPYIGNIVPIYNGSSFTPTTFAELTLALVSNHSADALFDVFVFNNSGAVTLITGPAWSTQTPGAGARGAGAGTTQLQRINGIWVNAVAMTGRNGTTTYSVGANLATYLGTFYTDHTAGQVTCHRAYGQNRKWGLWNAYNRVRLYLKGGDGTASWTPVATRAANNVPAAYSATVANVGSGTTANGLVVLSGLAEEIYYISHVQRGQAQASTTGTPHEATIGIGINSISAFSGKQGDIFISGNTGTVALNRSDLVGGFELAPSLGLNQIMAMENLVSGANIVIYGTESFMLLSAVWAG